MPTKRHIVRVISKIFDPVGIVSPFVIRLKLFLQDLHSNMIGWDEHINNELLSRWSDIIFSIKDNEPICINRYYFSGVSDDVREWQLCGCCDASTRAYAVVVYLRCITSGAKRTAFVVSKTRVGPLKEHSIPRLELLGAVLLARLMCALAKALKEEISLIDPVCYTDSLVALHWIKGVGRNWKPFVENRVCEIRKLVPVGSWKHCPGVENPEDIPT